MQFHMLPSWVKLKKNRLGPDKKVSWFYHTDIANKQQRPATLSIDWNVWAQHHDLQGIKSKGWIKHDSLP